MRYALLFLCSLVIQCISTRSAFAETATSPLASENIYISVQGDRDPEARKQQCVFLHNSIRVARGGPSDSDCPVLDSSQKIEEAKKSNKYRFHFVYTKNSDGTFNLSVENWKRDDPTDVDAVTWKIESAEQDVQKTAIQKALNRYFETHNNKRAIREFLLAVGNETSGLIKLDENGNYVDKRNPTNKLDFDQAYSIYWRENPKQKHYLRAALEMAAVLGMGFAGYWMKEETNKLDWDYNWDWKSWRKKLITGEAWKFDNNPMYMNAPGHPFAGAIYYSVARSNNLNRIESFLVSFAGSLLWESCVEFKEVISINDMVFTPFAGWTIGEAIFQLGEFFDRGEDNLINRALAMVFHGPTKVHNWVDKVKNVKVSPDVDANGLPSDVWHQFDIFGGPRVLHQNGTKKSRAEMEVGLDTQIMNILDAGKPGTVNKFIWDRTVFSQFSMKGTFSDTGFNDFMLFTKVVFAGYYKQSIEKGVNGDLKGYSFLIGPASAFHYSSHKSEFTKNPGLDNESSMDRIGIANVIGQTIDMTYYAGGFRVRATLDVFGDIAMVRSYAIDRWGAFNDETGLPSVLKNQRYYYAFGVTVNPKITVTKGPFEAGAEFRFDYFQSINGRDRLWEQVTNDPLLRDQRMSYKIWLSYMLPGDLVKVSLVFEQLFRSGSVGDAFTVRGVESIISVLGSVRF